MPAGGGMLVFLVGALVGAYLRQRRAQRKVKAWWEAANRK